MNELVNHPEWMPLLLDENGEATFDNASNVHRRGAEGELASSHLSAVEGEALAKYLFLLNNSGSVSPQSFCSGFRVQAVWREVQFGMRWGGR